MTIGVIESLGVFKSAIEQLEASVIITNTEGKIEYVNPFFTNQTGYTIDEVFGQSPRIINSGMQPTGFYENLWATINAGNTWNGELQNKKKTGELFWERVSISPIRDNEGTVTHFIAVYQDISKQKATEQELARKERLMNIVEEINQTGGWEYDLIKEEIYWTDELYMIHGFKKDTDIDFIAESLKCYHPEDAEKLKVAFNHVIASGKGYDLTARFTDANNTTKWLRTKTEAIKTVSGKISKIVGSVKDVTEEIVREKELKEIHTRLKYALLGTRAGMWDWDIKKSELVLDKRWAEMLGYTLEELSPTGLQTWEKLTHPEDLKKSYELIEKCFSGETSMYEFNLRMRHKMGHWVWINDRGAVFERAEDGTPLRMVGTHIDISDLIRDREKLLDSEKRYRALFEDSSDANLLEKDGIIIDCNQATVAMLGYDTKAEVIGKSIEEVSSDKVGDLTTADLFKKIQDTFKVEPHIRFEWVRIRKDQSTIPVEVMLTNLNHTDFENTRYVVWRDISKRKLAEKALVKSNEERGLLLGEIHHRVKNNLAIISGLVQLQMFKSKEKHDIQLLSKTVNRIRTIALIHEQLYQSDDFAGIPLAQNINKQIEFIQSMYTSEEIDIKMDLDLDEIYVNIDLAIPVGLLLNEILNNAYKYAFQDREEGIISIRLKEENGAINLTIKDNGVGMNEEEYYQESTLGRTLIENVLKQMEAEVTISMKDGVEYNVVFTQGVKLI